MTKRGSYFVSTLEEEGLTFVGLHDDELVVKNEQGEQEIYVENDNAACWTLEYNGRLYEFCSTLTA